ncbi:MAG: alanine racemase [Acidimicrobiaceae bacterium]|nr:alanine racemase [Acidimicrobiaceae bacterium]
MTLELRPAWAEVDLDAIRHNASLLAGWVAPSQLCAVVKARAYGHGAPQVARAALEGGATWLAVALVEEGIELRENGIDAPVLLLSEPPAEAMTAAVAANLTPTLYTHSGVLAAAAAARGPLTVHLKVDTGMHRVGAAPSTAVALCHAVAAHPSLMLGGLWTHFAVADEVDDPYTGDQLKMFAETVEALGGAGVRPPLLHAANSAAAMWHPATRLDMVRAGIALYGLSPAAPTSDGRLRAPVDQLQPAMSVKARVSYAKRVAAGERMSYGLRYTAPQDTLIATVPLGYADGITRSLGKTGGQVLVGGRRRPIAGTVTMDQILVDCGPRSSVRAGDEVVLLGRQGDECIDAWEWAGRGATIAYEVVCGISSRVPRHFLS